MNQATYQAGYNKSARQAGRFYRRVAGEINAACADGRLRCRAVFSSLIDPHAQNYLPHLPGSFRRMVSLFTSSDEIPKPQDIYNLPAEARSLFDSVTNRRAALRDAGTTIVRGWAFSPQEGLRGVLLRDAEGRVLAGGLLTPRPDVAAAFAAPPAAAPPNTGFELEISAASPQASSADLVFTTEGGKELVVRRPGATAGSPGGQLVYHIDVDATVGVRRRLENSVQSFIWGVHGKLIRVLTYTGAAALLLTLIFFRSMKWTEPAFLVMALLAGIIAGRVAVFTLIDASAYTANDIRYVFPVVYLYTCLLLMLIHRALALVTSRIDRRGFRWGTDFKKMFERTVGQPGPAERAGAATTGNSDGESRSAHAS